MNSMDCMDSVDSMDSVDRMDSTKRLIRIKIQKTNLSLVTNRVVVRDLQVSVPLIFVIFQHPSFQNGPRKHIYIYIYTYIYI